MNIYSFEFSNIFFPSFSKVSFKVFFRVFLKLSLKSVFQFVKFTGSGFITFSGRLLINSDVFMTEVTLLYALIVHLVIRVMVIYGSIKYGVPINHVHNSRKLFFFSPSKFRSSGWVSNVGIFYSIFVLYI